MTGTWPWPDDLDATVAAPDSHTVIFENDLVRVLEIVLASGTKEPEHTHRWPSVMTVIAPARIRFFAGGELAYESREAEPAGPRPPQWMDPEGPHSVENIDTCVFRAHRVELKRPRDGAPT